MSDDDGRMLTPPELAELIEAKRNLYRTRIRLQKLAAREKDAKVEDHLSLVNLRIASLEAEEEMEEIKRLRQQIGAHP